MSRRTRLRNDYFTERSRVEITSTRSRCLRKFSRTREVHSLINVNR